MERLLNGFVWALSFQGSAETHTIKNISLTYQYNRKTVSSLYLLKSMHIIIVNCSKVTYFCCIRNNNNRSLNIRYLPTEKVVKMCLCLQFDCTIYLSLLYRNITILLTEKKKTLNFYVKWLWTDSTNSSSEIWLN